MSTLILTQNTNVARHLQRCEKDINYQKDLSKKTWIPRPVQTVEDWVRHQASTVSRCDYQDWTVLSDMQEHMLWYRIISEWQNKQRDLLDVFYSEQERRQIALLNLNETAAAAAKCWKRLRQYLALETPYLGTLKSLKIGQRLWKIPAGSDDEAIAAYNLELLNTDMRPSGYDARHSHEFQHFVEWQRKFQQMCEKNRWIDPAVMPSLLTSFLQTREDAANILDLPDKIIAYGFINAPDKETDIRSLKETKASIAPQTVALLKAIAYGDRQVSFAHELSDIFDKVPASLNCRFTCKVTSSPRRNSKELQPDDALPVSIYSDDTQEFYATAQQIRQLAETDKMQNIGVILPKLDEVRDKIVSCFDETFCPRTVLPKYSNAMRPYTISLGKGLGEMPMVRSALDFLHLLTNTLEVRAVTNLINSPYICGHPEALNDCAYLDSKLRKTQKKFLSWAELCTIAAENQKRSNVSKSYNVFCKNLRKVQELLEQDDAKPQQLKDYAYWSGFFLEILKAIHWPVKRELRPEEHKQKNSFLTLIHGLRDLTLTSSQQLSCGDALKALGDLALASIFQPPPTPKAPIHVSGILEAVGLRFDRVFILNYTDQVWPSLSSPLPYLPIQLQTVMHMPGTENEELKLAKWINRRLSGLAPEGTISFANRTIENKNPREQHISRLIDSLNCQFDIEAAIDQNEKIGQPYYRKLIDNCFAAGSDDNASSAGAKNQYLEEHSNLAPPPPNPDIIKGGSSLLQNQIDCPFKALVSARWLKDELSESADSPDAMTKGNFIHNTLELLWKTWGSRYSSCKERVEEYRNINAADYPNQAEYAKALKQTRLYRDIHESVSAVLKEQEEKRPDFGSIFYRLETQRLVELLLDWFIRIETNRHKGADDYKVRCEDEVTLELGHCRTNTAAVPTQTDEQTNGDQVSGSRALKLCLRLDRIDEFEIASDNAPHSSYYLSDYKTSDRYRIHKWYDPNDPGAAPKDVQLPLYAVYISRKYGEEALRGMGYDRLLAKRQQIGDGDQKQIVYSHSVLAVNRNDAGQADTSSCVLTGKKELHSNDSDKKAYKDKPLFSGLLTNWENTLEQAAQDFLDGKHQVKPRTVQDSCQYCHFLPICRRQD